MKKILLRLIYVAALLLVLLLLGSWAYTRYLGKDITELSATDGGKSFSAQRDPATGAWKVRAKTREDLWFAFGYLQAWDREFQLELLRLASLGQLTSVLGEKMLPQDRLMRAAARTARLEESFYAPEGDALRSTRAFMQGVQALRKDHPDRLPIEMKLLNLTREDLPAWEPWHLFAISRFHAWQFSFDLTLETLHHALSEGLGSELAQQMMPRGDSPAAKSFYAQPGLYGVAKRPLAPPQSLPPHLGPSEGAALQLSPSEYPLKKPTIVAGLVAQGAAAGDWALPSALLGASNLWIVADARVGRAPTLCNDPHLRLSWPSPLYPISYTLGASKAVEVQATGVLLPGTPLMVIGAQERPQAGERFVWGVTLAAYADTQDLVALDKSTPTWTLQETYRIRSLETGAYEERVLDEQQSAWGPVVNEALDWGESPPKSRVALDWMGYRKGRWTFDFFLKRNFQGAENLAQDLQEHWPFPAVNFSWMVHQAPSATGQAKQAPIHFGHAVTGLLYERPRDLSSLAILSEKQAKARTLSQPRDRPFLWTEYDPQKPFLMAQSNQRVWKENFSNRVAHFWTASARADRVESQRDRLLIEPEFSQIDWYAPTLVQFYKDRRSQLKASVLCGGQSPQDFDACLHLLSQLDKWDGRAVAAAWEPTVVSLWYSLFKQDLIRRLAPKRFQEKPELTELVARWQRRSFSDKALMQFLKNDPSVEWLGDLGQETFQQALQLLNEELGPGPELWTWGPRHRIDWLHPFAAAPKPWGPWLRDSLLGPAPPVSGALDSPGRFEFTWSAQAPLHFPATHGAVLRMCSSLESDGSLSTRWATSTGPSGNPFSRWARKMTEDWYLQGKLAPGP